VGIHALGHVAETTQQAADDYFPGYARMFGQIGKERGWPPISRAQFEAVCGPGGALIIGDPKTAAEKILHYNDVLGGIDRITIQMSPGTLPHSVALKGIELIGTQVAPAVREQLGGRK